MEFSPFLLKCVNLHGRDGCIDVLRTSGSIWGSKSSGGKDRLAIAIFPQNEECAAEMPAEVAFLTKTGLGIIRTHSFLRPEEALMYDRGRCSVVV